MTQAVERAYREQWARLVALLADKLRSLDLAEDCAAEAFAAAVQRWPDDGVPAHPEGWLYRTALRRGIDAQRRVAALGRKLALLVVEQSRHHDAPDVDVEVDMVEDGAAAVTLPDHRLRMLFTCCHPGLAVEARVALTLRLLGGLRTGEIARALLPDRLAGVLAVLYLIFAEGYAATTGRTLVRTELADQAIRLTRILSDAMPDEPEVAGLLALMLFQHARRDTRVDSSGRLVLLAEQDRSRWDQIMIAEGQRLLARAGSPGPYRIQAAIAAVHAGAAQAADTDWRLISDLVAQVNGSAAGLALLNGLAASLDRHHMFYAIRADLLRRVGREHDAVQDYQRALDRCTNEIERAFLGARLTESRARRIAATQ